MRKKKNKRSDPQELVIRHDCDGRVSVLNPDLFFPIRLFGTHLVFPATYINLEGDAESPSFVSYAIEDAIDRSFCEANQRGNVVGIVSIGREDNDLEKTWVLCWIHSERDTIDLHNFEKNPLCVAMAVPFAPELFEITDKCSTTFMYSIMTTLLRLRYRIVEGLQTGNMRLLDKALCEGVTEILKDNAVFRETHDPIGAEMLRLLANPSRSSLERVKEMCVISLL